jgi:hypothetical protein
MIEILYLEHRVLSMKRIYEKPTLTKAEIRLQGVTAGGPSKVTAPTGNSSTNGS